MNPIVKEVNLFIDFSGINNKDSSFNIDSVIPNPVIGFSISEDFEFCSKRDMMIPCKGIAIPTEFKSQNNPSLAVYYHDCYHLINESYDVHRKLWVELAGQLERSNVSSNVRETYVDRDFSYSSELNQDHKLIFFYTYFLNFNNNLNGRRIN